MPARTVVADAHQARRSVRIEYGHSIRSAITVAGICGQAANSSRILGSASLTTDTAGGRSYCGGPSEARAAFTVFREIRNTRATSESGNRSDRRNRRISAQSSTLNTRFLPWLIVLGLQEAGQFSAGWFLGGVATLL